jgi:hypothetical protein
VIADQTCSDCGEQKPEKMFAVYRNREGQLRRRGICKLCRNRYAQDNFDKLQEYRKQYNAKNRSKKAERDRARREELRKVVDAAKDVPCADCGKRWPPVAMDFDHINGEKVKAVATLLGGAYRVETILEEIKKCEVVCACCHRIRTWNRKQHLGRVPEDAIDPEV